VQHLWEDPEMKKAGMVNQSSWFLGSSTNIKIDGIDEIGSPGWFRMDMSVLENRVAVAKNALTWMHKNIHSPGSENGHRSDQHHDNLHRMFEGNFQIPVPRSWEI
jgi:hypothetical protein